MKLCILVAWIVVGVLAEQEDDIWFQYNRRMPGAYYSWSPPQLPKPLLGRIVGGLDADIADYPYQLSLRRSGSHSCGASVISARWALSAAHCTFPPPSVAALSLYGGSSSRLTGGIEFSVEEFHNHPNYDDWNVQNDVCVLRAVSDLSAAFIAPITLDPVGAEHAPNSRAVVTGWGRNGQGVLPTVLKWADIPIVSMEDCRSQWPAEWVFDDMICASELGRDACNGDSGGPLVIGRHQIGIVSWGDTDCVGTYPGVYTRVAHPQIRNFITSITGV